MKNSKGGVVSKKAHAAGKRRYGNIKDWIESVRKARKIMGGWGPRGHLERQIENMMKGLSVEEPEGDVFSLSKQLDN